MTDLLHLYGTEEPPADPPVRRVGALSFEWTGTGLRHVRLGGTELIRSVAFLARDRDWGTLTPEPGGVEETWTEGVLCLTTVLVFRTGGASLTVALSVRASETGITLEATGNAAGAFETNRAGFTVLHPITGQAGAPVSVTHSDGSEQHSVFPDLIAPWQPFMDIAAITHHAGDMACTCRFAGDVFEMEDQRQWGDASFKTYNRPLARPWPYVIAAGEPLRQSVELSWRRAAPVPAPTEPALPSGPRFPDTALVVTSDEARRLAAGPDVLDAVAPQRLLCHLDATLGDVDGQCAAFATLQAAFPASTYDLELIGAFDGDPEAELAAHARAAANAGFSPASVMVCPSVDRQSTPPGSDWPDCPPLETIHAAARAAFDAPVMGGGMASLFTELNRKPPPSGMLDFVTHALCPIVHDADDVSVMETLEAVPHITRSARALIGEAEYRIGPCTIAMRQNPYGSRTIPNPGGSRVCMTDNDPRHRGAFGAAYALGLATALAPAGPSVWTPAAVFGPRGLFARDGTLLQVAEVIRALAACAGRPVTEAAIRDGRARMTLGDTVFEANLTPETKEGLPPFGWRSLF
ncbi:hypothetical protein [Tranquillimonas rosea]|uniref:hypothetical protein n=1 Tax=Tranquillimonas rosea TaxID=641238 RepID=UPI003BAAC303